MTILEALAALDPKNPDHWTKDGAPDLKTVQTSINDFQIKRADIVKVAPLFNKERALAGFAPDAPAAVPDAPVESVLEQDEVTNDVPDEVVLSGVKDMATLQEELRILNVAKNDAMRAFNAKQSEIDALIDSGHVDNEPFHVTMQGYKRAQQDNREDRADNREVVAALGKAGLLKTHSPIDTALARRNARGTERPKLG